MKNMMPRNFKSAANKLTRVMDYIGYQIHQTNHFESVIAMCKAEEVIRKARRECYSAAQD